MTARRRPRALTSSLGDGDGETWRLPMLVTWTHFRWPRAVPSTRTACARSMSAIGGLALARVLERSPLRLVVDLDRRVDTGLVEETLAIERECCPFYELDWEPDRRRLRISVSEPEHAPALEAIAFALGLDAPTAQASA